VLPEKGSHVAFTFSSLIFQISCFGLPFAFGYIHDYSDPPSYDKVFLISGGIGGFNTLLVLLLWRIAPKIQEIQRVVLNRQYYRPVVVLRDKRGRKRRRRHSFNVGELETLKEKIEEKKGLRINDIVNVNPLTSQFYKEDPQLLSVLYTPDVVV